uniref:Uncharacterized protein n=1 Tax=Oryza glumipatula TaxID=40148 RepID=A0A0D9ZNJ8_9ORYZ
MLSWWCEARKSVHKTDRKTFDAGVILVTWLVWKERNAQVFDGKATSAVHLCATIADEWETWKAAGSKQVVLSLFSIWDWEETEGIGKRRHSGDDNGEEARNDTIKEMFCQLTDRMASNHRKKNQTWETIGTRGDDRNDRGDFIISRYGQIAKNTNIKAKTRVETCLAVRVVAIG